MLFLQIAEAYGQGLASRLSDQLFSVVLLVGFAIYSLRRQKQIEDKLEKYMQEDREEMKDVIAANTKAFENLSMRISAKSLLILAIGGVFMLTSCGVFKKHTKTELSIRDSIERISIEEVEFLSIQEIETKDTIISISSRLATGVLKPPDLTPIFTISGEVLPRSHTFRDKGVKVDLTVLPSGDLQVDCYCDSLQLLVEKLRKEKLTTSGETKKRNEVLKTSVTEQKQTTAKGIGNLGDLATYFGVMALAFVTGYLISYFKLLRQ